MKYLFILLTLILSLNLLAQNKFKAGNISIENTDGDLTIDIRVELFTSIDSQIDSVNICFGDGFCEWVISTEQQEFSELNVLKSTFIVSHIYAGQAIYSISMLDCCWSEEGLNTLELSNSVFAITRDYIFFNPVFNPPGNSPISINSLNVIVANNLEALNFSPQFYDSDGDSISLKLIHPGNDSTYLSEYLFPDEINPGPNNNFSINEQNQIIWDSPQEVGEYHFAYELLEYREGQQISRGYGISLIIIQDPTSIKESFENKFKIYPNPTKDVIKIDGENFDELEVYNLLGEKIISKNTETEEINLSNLPKGVYLLSLIQNNEKYSTLVVKN